jgi:hypothetical protein
MATKTTTTKTVISDLSDDHGATRFTFSVDGDRYRIDLTDKEKADFRKSVEQFVKAATAVKSKPTGNSRSKEIRAWAASKGITVPARGRISASIEKAYLDGLPTGPSEAVYDAEAEWDEADPKAKIHA